MVEEQLVRDLLELLVESVVVAEDIFIIHLVLEALEVDLHCSLQKLVVVEIPVLEETQQCLQVLVEVVEVLVMQDLTLSVAATVVLVSSSSHILHK